MKHLAIVSIIGCLVAWQGAAEGTPTWRATRLEPLEFDAREGNRQGRPHRRQF